MKSGRPSDTAAARAFGSHVRGSEHILADPLAEHFIGPRYWALHRLIRLGVAPLNLAMVAVHDRILPGAVGWVLTRHRYFDDRIEEAVRNGARQIVFVGAGYDSRAFRLQTLTDVRIFEVDHPDTQARKKRIVRQLFGELPKRIEYVPLNATRGDLRQLPDHGFDLMATSVFVLEGFLWYMPPEIARAILVAIAGIAAPGSQMIFDYILPSVVDGSSVLEGAREHRRYCERRGEPVLFGIEPGQLSGYLHENGLRLIDDVGSDTLKARYPGHSRRESKISPFLRIATAEVERKG